MTQAIKIGLEIHVAIPTKTKLFCSCSAYNEHEPNMSVCPICMGFPGSKPMLNAKALEIAKSVANALHSDIAKTVSFERKVYFYPDLPKSFQITQLSNPVSQGGFIELQSSKRIRIRRIQIEEDPAKILHEEDYSLIDFNRSGRPLLEIVTEPDIFNIDELKEFMNELKSILYYLGIDINTELKADVNVSNQGERVEIKNITGLKDMINAALFEIKRQETARASGLVINKETRSYDEAKMATMPMREKETDEEYGIIYEPDLGDYSIENIPIIEPVYASKIAKELAEKYSASEKLIIEQIMFDRNALQFINKFAGTHKINIVISAIEVLKRYNKTLDEYKFEALLTAISKNVLINSETINAIEQGKAIEASSEIDESLIDSAINSMILENKQLLKDYRKNSKVFNFVIGQIAKKYNASPKYISTRLNILLPKFVAGKED
jgi:aspartyl-tRNA(Asn)/glutamyl-tRNA(Gln) amidotransferase subunit B